jgi:hypothetical protein
VLRVRRAEVRRARAAAHAAPPPKATRASCAVPPRHRHVPRPRSRRRRSRTASASPPSPSLHGGGARRQPGRRHLLGGRRPTEPFAQQKLYGGDPRSYVRDRCFDPRALAAGGALDGERDPATWVPSLPITSRGWTLPRVLGRRGCTRGRTRYDSSAPSAFRVCRAVLIVLFVGDGIALSRSPHARPRGCRRLRHARPGGCLAFFGAFVELRPAFIVAFLVVFVVPVGLASGLPSQPPCARHCSQRCGPHRACVHACADLNSAIDERLRAGRDDPGTLIEKQQRVGVRDDAALAVRLEARDHGRRRTNGLKNGSPYR